MFTVTVNKKEFKIESTPKQQTIDGRAFEADILEYNPGKFHVIRNNKSYSAELMELNKEEKSVLLKINNRVYSVTLKDKYDDLLRELGIDVAGSKKVNVIKAPMPGLVLNILVQNGQTISKGDALVVLEAMKMENVLKSPSDGVVKKIHVDKGDKVDKNQVMINLV